MKGTKEQGGTRMEPTQLLIDMDQFHENIRRILDATSADVMAVLKANAYGHGIELAQALETYDRIPLIAVATVVEAIALRRFSTKDILVLGVLLENQCATAIQHNLISILPAWLDPDSLPGPMRFFINIDTGFHRFGLEPSSKSIEQIEHMQAHDNVTIEGIYTHLRLMDDAADDIQIKTFQNLIASLSFQPRYLSIADSIALTRHPEWGNLVRIGALMYGLESDRERGKLSVAPIATLRSRITHVTAVDAGDALYYSNKPLTRPTRVATIPIGYADGLPRTIPDGLTVLVHDVAVPYLAISMDHSAIDITDVDATIGDAVIVFGGNGLSVAAVARLCKTNKNDVVSGLHHRIPRTHVRLKGESSHDL